MANTVETIFTGKPDQLFRAADEVEKRLKSLANLTTDKLFSDPKNLKIALDIQQKQLAVETQNERLKKAQIQTQIEKNRLTEQELKTEKALELAIKAELQ